MISLSPPPPHTLTTNRPTILRVRSHPFARSSTTPNSIIITPFISALGISDHTDPLTPSASTIFGLSHPSANSIRVARVAEQRGVELIQVLDLAIELETEYRQWIGEERKLESTYHSAPPDSQVQAPRPIPNSAPPLTSYRTTERMASQFGDEGDTARFPPVDQSFMRWSKTASTIFSDQHSNFYFDKRSTAHYSDFSPLPSTPEIEPSPRAQDNMSHPATTPPARPDLKRRESTNSAGTFGSRQRRWSALHSSPETITIPTDISPPPSAARTSIEETLPVAGPSSRSGRRPMSMSSASDSTLSGLANLGHSHSDRIRIGRSNISGAMFPSPTLKRPVHKSPESDADITAYLLKVSSRNDSRIVPGPPRPGPTVGTPIPGKVKEETSPGAHEDSDEDTRKRRHFSKLDKILGEGAETARVLMEFDRRAIRDVVDMPAMTQLPPPPRHKVSASVPNSSAIPILPPSTPPNSSPPRLSRTDDLRSSPPFRGRHGSLQYSPHRRSNSVDSIPSSLHPSLADSTHTMARLLPAQPPVPTQPLPRIPTDKEIAKSRSLAIPHARNELSPEQRAMLVRRTRKIERMLGEPLGEITVGQLIVGPSTASTVIHTVYEHDMDYSPPSRDRIPEYERQDCQPRTVRALDRPAVVTGKKGTSRIALKAMAALGLGADKREDEDLRVYISREKTVSEVRREYLVTPESPRGSIRDDGPNSPVEDRFEDEEDTTRRARRLQVAKLHRILGVPVPASALQPQNTGTLDSPSTPNSRRPVTPQRMTSASDVSFISFEDDTPSPSWSKRMRAVVSSSNPKDRGSSFWDGTLNRSNSIAKGKKNSPPPAIDQSFGSRDKIEGSFMDLKDDRKAGYHRSMGMRTASRLEKVLGSLPPPEDFPPARIYEDFEFPLSPGDYHPHFTPYTSPIDGHPDGGDSAAEDERVLRSQQIMEGFFGKKRHEREINSV